MLLPVKLGVEACLNAFAGKTEFLEVPISPATVVMRDDFKPLGATVLSFAVSTLSRGQHAVAVMS